MKKSTTKKEYGLYELIKKMIARTPEERPLMENVVLTLETQKTTLESDQRPTTANTEVIIRWKKMFIKSSKKAIECPPSTFENNI